jgi:hypothetical protein
VPISDGRKYGRLSSFKDLPWFDRLPKPVVPFWQRDHLGPKYSGVFMLPMCHRLAPVRLSEQCSPLS